MRKCPFDIVMDLRSAVRHTDLGYQAATRASLQEDPQADHEPHVARGEQEQPGCPPVSIGCDCYAPTKRPPPNGFAHAKNESSAARLTRSRLRTCGSPPGAAPSRRSDSPSPSWSYADAWTP